MQPVLENLHRIITIRYQNAMTTAESTEECATLKQVNVCAVGDGQVLKLITVKENMIRIEFTPSIVTSNAITMQRTSK